MKGKADAVGSIPAVSFHLGEAQGRGTSCEQPSGVESFRLHFALFFSFAGRERGGGGALTDC